MSPNCNAADLPKGSHSTHAVGRRRPDPKGSKKLDKDIEVPCGKQEDFNKSGACISANEWVVYNTNQIRMRYLLTFKM